ncbi:MAG: response regulator transcription factor [Armatimonadetes bacterium]|nr:response regulator transcription factor [Armatimonadota bacterium]
MHIVLFNDNAIRFSDRLFRGLTDLGHEVGILGTPPGLCEYLRKNKVDVAIVDLGADTERRPATIRTIKQDYPSLKVLGYARYGEVDVWASARDAGCDLVVSTSTINGDVTGSLLRLMRGHL